MSTSKFPFITTEVFDAEFYVCRVVFYDGGEIRTTFIAMISIQYLNRYNIRSSLLYLERNVTDPTVDGSGPGPRPRIVSQ